MIHVCCLKQGDKLLHKNITVTSELVKAGVDSFILTGAFQLHDDPLPDVGKNYILESDGGQVCEVMITSLSGSLIQFNGQGETWH